VLYTLVIPPLWRLGQEDLKFKDSKTLLKGRKERKKDRRGGEGSEGEIVNCSYSINYLLSEAVYENHSKNVQTIYILVLNNRNCYFFSVQMLYCLKSIDEKFPSVIPQEI
jgi:hypothetical protein